MELEEGTLPGRRPAALELIDSDDLLGRPRVADFSGKPLAALRLAFEYTDDLIRHVDKTVEGVRGSAEDIAAAAVLRAAAASKEESIRLVEGLRALFFSTELLPRREHAGALPELDARIRHLQAISADMKVQFQAMESMLEQMRACTEAVLQATSAAAVREEQMQRAAEDLDRRAEQVRLEHVRLEGVRQAAERAKAKLEGARAASLWRRIIG